MYHPIKITSACSKCNDTFIISTLIDGKSAKLAELDNGDIVGGVGIFDNCILCPSCASSIKYEEICDEKPHFIFESA